MAIWLPFFRITPYIVTVLGRVLFDVRCKVTRYFPGTVGVNRSVERSKLLLVSKVSVVQSTVVSVEADTLWATPFLCTIKLGPLVAVVTPCHEPFAFLNSSVPALSRKP